MLEIETPGPTARLEPPAFVEHVEDWFLFRDVPTPEKDSDVVAHVLPRIPSDREAARPVHCGPCSM